MKKENSFILKKRKKAHKSLAIAGALCYSIMVL